MGGKWWWFPTKAFSLQLGCFAGSHLCSQVIRRARELENARIRLAVSPGLAWPPEGQETQGYARGRPGHGGHRQPHALQLSQRSSPIQEPLGDPWAPPAPPELRTASLPFPRFPFLLQAGTSGAEEAT